MNFKDVVNLKNDEDKDNLICCFSKNPAAWLLYWSMRSGDIDSYSRYKLMIEILLNYERLSKPLDMYEGDN